MFLSFALLRGEFGTSLVDYGSTKKSQLSPKHIVVHLKHFKVHTGDFKTLSKLPVTVGPSMANISVLCLSLCVNSVASNHFLFCLTDSSTSICPTLYWISSRGCLLVSAHILLFIPVFSRSLLHPLSLLSGLSSALFISPASVFHLLSLSAHCPSSSEDSVASSQLSILPAWAEKQTGVHMFPGNFNDFHNSGVFTCQTPGSTREQRRASLSALVTSSLNLSQEAPFEGLSKHLLEWQVKYFFF